jgi:hypothetical protein
MEIAKLVRTVVPAVLVLIAIAAATGSASAAKKPPKAPADVRSAGFAFTETDLFRGSPNAFGEPSIALSSKDHVFLCGPQGIGAGNQFVRTADWTTFETFLITDTPVDGEDCDVKVGADDAVYEANLQIFGGAIRKSVADGQGPPAPPNTTGNGSFDYQVTEDPVEQDRQWLAPDPADASILYYGYHDFASESEVVAKSLDGGKTFPIHTVSSSDPTLLTDTLPNTFSGPVRVDPVDHLTVVQVYAISTAADNAGACNTETACFGMPKRIVAAVSNDGGLTWTDHLAMDVAGKGNEILGNLFPWVTWDRAGNLYVMAALGGQDAEGHPTNGVYYAVSEDKGATWSAMHKVNAGTGAVVFPTMAGGSDGVVDFAWLESSATDQDTVGTWRLHFAQSRNAAAAMPTSTDVTGPVVRTGTVCTLGILCNGGRELADFMEIALDSFGYAHVAAPATDAADALYDIYWRQDAGPSATGTPCTPTCVATRPGPRP